MPRVSYVDQVKYRTECTKDKINGDMSRMGITRKDIGKLWGKSPQAAGQNISKMNMTFVEFIQLVKELDWSEDQIIRAVKL